MILIKLLQLHVLLFGLAAVSSRYIAPFPLARIISPVALTLALFFVEHFVGLGTLPAVGWLATLAAGFILLWRWDAFRKTVDLDFERAHAALFGYSLLWRFTFPDLHGDYSERLMNLTFIAAYSRGETLPPTDAWLAPYSLNIYYAFQHYAAGVLARLLSAEPGEAYHLAFCTIVGLTGGAAFWILRQFSRRRWQAWLVLATLFLGGTGVSALVHLMKDNVRTADAMAFIGDAASFRNTTTSFGQWLLRISGVPRENATMLPVHTPSFLLQLGDYHAPLSGLFLLVTALLTIVILEKRGSRAGVAYLGASIPLCVAANAWTAPLQALLIVAWVLFRLRGKKPVDWVALIGGAVLTAALLVPFLRYFLANTSGAKMSIKLVPYQLHTPLILGLLVWLPIVLLAIANWRKDAAPAAKWLVGFFAVAFALTELFHVDDLYGAPWDRFNTTLKMWGWIWVGVLLIAGADALQSAARWRRVLALAALCLPLTNVFDLAAAYVAAPKNSMGVMQGWGALSEDPAYGPALEYLRRRPKGLVLELVESDQYTLVPSLAIFSGHNAFVGWPEHERVWRGGLPLIYQRESESRQFYFGQMEDPAAWLQANGITDVAWMPTVHTLPLEALQSVFNALRNSPYRWTELHRDQRGIYGIFSRQ